MPRTSTPLTAPARLTARLAPLLALVLSLGVLGGLGSATTAAAADPNPVTPGDFTGLGFDQCLAPTQSTMDRWLETSPFLAVGIYVSGDSRGCRDQPNLTPRWVRIQLRKGWQLLPITLGPQASCQPSFPRYADDRSIDPSPGRHGDYAHARRMGRHEASSSAADAAALGLSPGSTLWYDLEGFDSTSTACRESALAFLSGWSYRLHDLGWVSGVYSSAGSGMSALDDARVSRPDAFTLPDRIWIARWDGVANTSTSYLREDGWRPGGRVKQFQGGHPETWGGVRIDVDRDYLDLGRGSVAPSEDHCDGTRVNFRTYDGLRPAHGSYTAPSGKVTALQCLLTEQGLYTGPLTGAYNDRTVDAVHAWRAARGDVERDSFHATQWMSLLAAGPRPVLKKGSAGSDVRRLQRALNAASTEHHLRPRGVFNDATDTALRAWQRAVGLPVSGVQTKPGWSRLVSGER